MANSIFSKPLNLAVLLGGTSAEREVSLDSGAAVSRALVSCGHRVTEIDPQDVDLRQTDWRDFDAVFIALHGTFGEDGEVQSLLAAADVPYTGSGPEASRWAFDKQITKQRFAEAGVPTPAVKYFRADDDLADIAIDAFAFGFPVVIKPAKQGSSLGVTIVNSAEQIPEAVARCFELDDVGLLEAYIAGTEWTLAVVDDQPLPLLQIETSRGFFDYHAKYQDDATGYKLEFELPAETIQALETVGLAACRSLNTAGLVRVDLRLDQSLQPWVLEVNTIPGMTDHSLAPKAAAQFGWSFAELCERVVSGCLNAANDDSVGCSEPGKGPQAA